MIDIVPTIDITGWATSAVRRHRVAADFDDACRRIGDPVPGLQIVGPDGAWHDVLPLADGVVVNLGDAISIWTNDRWRSTLHRVVPPPPGPNEARRRSFAFFHDGNADAVMSCLPSCCSDDDPPRYAPLTLGDHVRGKLLGPRTLRQSHATQTIGDRQRAVDD